MRRTIFLSWQSDTPNAVGRTFIENCLADAIKAMNADVKVRPADREISLDKDTLGVPGSPAIADTIYRKIDGATVFLSDLTYVALREGGGGIPNPNVSVEHGWALKSLGPERVISVMNTAFGNPKDHELPFDLRHVRWPISFRLLPDADADARAHERKRLTRTLADALKAILTDEPLMARLLPARPAEPHPHDVDLLGRVHRQLSPRLRQFLHEHSFGSPFRFSQTGPIHEINESWLGASFEFHDGVLQEAFSKVRHVAGEFGPMLLERIFPDDRNPRIGNARTDVDRAQGVQPSTLAGIRDMNVKAAQLSVAIDAFDRIARERIRISSGAHADRAGVEGHDRFGAARLRIDELAADESRGGVPVLVGLPRLTLRLAPLRALEGRRLETRLVANARLRFPPSIDEREATGVDGTQWWSSAVPCRRGDFPNPEAAWMMRLVRPGLLEWQARIGERLDDDPTIAVDGRRLEGEIVRNLERMGAIAASLGLDGPASASMSLDGIEGVELTRARPGGRPIRRHTLALRSIDIDDCEEPVASALREWFNVVWQEAGWSNGSPSFEEGPWTGYVNRQAYGMA